MPQDHDIKVGDLVVGTSMHNYDLIGLVVSSEKNKNPEYKVHWLVERRYKRRSFYEVYERFYDIQRIS